MYVKNIIVSEFYNIKSTKYKIYKYATNFKDFLCKRKLFSFWVFPSAENQKPEAVFDSWNNFLTSDIYLLDVLYHLRSAATCHSIGKAVHFFEQGDAMHVLEVVKKKYRNGKSGAGIRIWRDRGKVPG